MSRLETEMDQISLVGVMDTAEDFAQWWLLLGAAAHFDAEAAAQLSISGAHDNTMQASGWQEAATLSPAQRDSVKALNPCSQRVYESARRRLEERVAEQRQHFVPTEDGNESQAQELLSLMRSLAGGAHRARTATELMSAVDPSGSDGPSIDSSSTSASPAAGRPGSSGSGGFDERVERLLSTWKGVNPAAL